MRFTRKHVSSTAKDASQRFAMCRKKLTVSARRTSRQCEGGESECDGNGDEATHPDSREINEASPASTAEYE
jgi:hypothetical protein